MRAGEGMEVKASRGRAKGRRKEEKKEKADKKKKKTVAACNYTAFTHTFRAYKDIDICYFLPIAILATSYTTFRRHFCLDSDRPKPLAHFSGNRPYVLLWQAILCGLLTITASCCL